MLVPTRRLAGLAAFSAILLVPRGAAAQVSMFEACSQGPIANCAEIRLTSVLGGGSGGSNLFEIALQNLGSQSPPGLATSIYFLAFLTGQPPAPEIDPFATPTAEGGASILDASDWSIAETGDVILLEPPANNGIGGCASAVPPLGDVGQMANTCPGQFVSFSFSTPRAFDPSTFSLADLEIAGVADGSSESCNAATPCAITPLTVTPEPSAVLLVATGFCAIAGVALRRRGNASQTRIQIPSEV